MTRSHMRDPGKAVLNILQPRRCTTSNNCNVRGTAVARNCVYNVDRHGIRTLSWPKVIASRNCNNLPASQPRRHLANVRDDNRPLSEIWFTGSFPPSSGTQLGDTSRKKVEQNLRQCSEQKSTGRRPEDEENEGNGGKRSPNERTVKLGKTIQILRSRLPTLLASPLPTEILSPHISLYLFPSTHPHLPTVSGRIAYNAALWTAPVAWGRVPVVGNVRLIILSERMIKDGNGLALDDGLYHHDNQLGKTTDYPGPPHHDGTEPSQSKTSPSPNRQTIGPERLIVKWKTCASPSSRIPEVLETLRSYAFSESSPGIIPTMPPLQGPSIRPSTANPSSNTSPNTTSTSNENSSNSKPSSNSAPEQETKEFSGLFIFAFDDQGRIASHTIEHTHKGGDADKTTRVVNMTDWLLGKAKRKKGEEPEFAFGFFGLDGFTCDYRFEGEGFSRAQGQAQAQVVVAGDYQTVCRPGNG